QSRPEQVRSVYWPPGEVVRQARESGSPVIAYTYSEPVIFFEYVTDVAQAARAAGVKSVVVTGGYIQTDPLKELCKHVDAIKVDLKGYSLQFYADVVHG